MKTPNGVTLRWGTVLGLIIFVGTVVSAHFLGLAQAKEDAVKLMNKHETEYAEKIDNLGETVDNLGKKVGKLSEAQAITNYILAREFGAAPTPLPSNETN